MALEEAYLLAAIGWANTIDSNQLVGVAVRANTANCVRGDDA